MNKRMGSARLAATMMLLGMACTPGNVETNAQGGGSDAAGDASLDGTASDTSVRDGDSNAASDARFDGTVSETGVMCAASQRRCGARCVACPSDANSTGTTCNGNLCVISACGNGLSPNAMGSACVTDSVLFQGAPVDVMRPSGTSQFGWSVSLSGDGNTLLVGDNDGGGDRKGAATVYTQSAGSWSAGSTLTRPSGAVDFGESISLSGDGNTLVVGDYNGGGDSNGAATVYTRSGGNWSTRTDLTRPSGAVNFGWSVSLSEDGNTLAVGDWRGNGVGTAVTVYTRSAGNWDAGTSITRPSGQIPFGWRVSLSGDGNTLVVIADRAWVYTRSGGIWSAGISLTTPRLVRNYGWGISVTRDGNTLVVGDWGSGDVTEYTRSGGSWSTGTNVTHLSGQSAYITSVALSGDGNTLVVGAYIGGGGQNGSATVYTRSGGNWGAGTDLTRPSGAFNFGWSVSLSQDGNTLVVGDHKGGGDQNGAVSVYTR